MKHAASVVQAKDVVDGASAKQYGRYRWQQCFDESGRPPLPKCLKEITEGIAPTLVASVIEGWCYAARARLTQLRKNKRQRRDQMLAGKLAASRAVD